jgi:arylsulfatase A-like enzyme
VLIAVVACLAALSIIQGAEPPRPNVIFIIADDLGWRDVGYHDSEIRTPVLDRLAAEGARLEQHYVTPVCWTTRECLLGGRGTKTLSVLDRGSEPKALRPPPDTTSLQAALRSVGYSTHITGKWHINSLEPDRRPRKHGFDTSYGYLHGQIDPYLPHHYKRNNRTWHRNDELVDEPGHVTDLLTDEAIRVIESEQQKPFFLYVAYSVPHYPLDEPEEWIAPYQGKIEDRWRRLFAACVSHMDHAVGRIVDALEQTGLRQQTLIVFTSDNGGQQSWKAPKGHYEDRYEDHTTLGSNLPLRGWKGQVYEGGVRVPTLVSWPGKIPAGKVVTEPACILDWMPTFSALAGYPLQLERGGRDIWPMITGNASGGQRTFYWQHGSKIALRQGDWKLVGNRDFTRPELFNLADDPNETENLADQRPQRVAELKSLVAPQ